MNQKCVLSGLKVRPDQWNSQIVASFSYSNEALRGGGLVENPGQKWTIVPRGVCISVGPGSSH